MKTSFLFVQIAFGMLSVESVKTPISSSFTGLEKKYLYERPMGHLPSLPFSGSVRHQYTSGIKLNPNHLQQSEESAVKEVRRMFEEVQQMPKNRYKEYNSIRYHTINASEPKIPFDQKVRVYQMGKGYELTVGEIGGWEWEETVSIYKKNGRIFFILVEGSGVAMLYEHRFYCDSNEKVVRRLKKESLDDDLAKIESKKIPLPQGDRSIQIVAKKYLQHINSVTASN